MSHFWQWVAQLQSVRRTYGWAGVGLILRCASPFSIECLPPVTWRRTTHCRLRHSQATAGAEEVTRTASSSCLERKHTGVRSNIEKHAETIGERLSYTEPLTQRSGSGMEGTAPCYIKLACYLQWLLPLLKVHFPRVTLDIVPLSLYVMCTSGLLLLWFVDIFNHIDALLIVDYTFISYIILNSLFTFIYYTLNLI